VGCAPVEALTISTVQDRALAALAQHEVDRAGHPWDEGNDRRLVAFADDAQRSMASIKAEIFRVGRTGLAHPESVHSVGTASAGRSARTSSIQAERI
jgi:hypothetical protein